MATTSILGAAVLAASLHVPAVPVTGAVRGRSPPASHVSQENCLAQNVYFEARGEPLAGMVAVGWVALNRASRTGGTPCGVVHQRLGGRCQFDWVCKSHRAPSGDPWERSRAVARALGDVSDPTGGATYFAVCGRHLPGGLTMTRHIGRHCFWRDGPARSVISYSTYSLVPAAGNGWLLSDDRSVRGVAAIRSMCPVRSAGGRRGHRDETFLEVAEAQ